MNERENGAHEDGARGDGARGDGARGDKVKPVSGLVVEPEALKQSPLHADPEPSDVNLRVAGGVLLANVVLAVASMIKTGAPLAGPGTFHVAYVFDAVVGVALLMGLRKWVGLALVRACLGGILITAIRAGTGDTVGAILQAIYASSFLVLLIGQPRPFRLRLGTALGGAIILLELWGVFFFKPVEGELMRVKGGVVSGREFAYTYEVPRTYKLREDAAAKVDNPLADTWVVDVNHDTHVLVVCERAPAGDVFLPEASRQAVLTNVLAQGEKLSETPLVEKEGVHTGRVEVRSRTTGLELRYLIDVHVREDRLCSVYGFTAEHTFGQVERDLRRILDSFRLDAEP